jgi:hypothetical protein
MSDSPDPKSQGQQAWLRHYEEAARRKLAVPARQRPPALCRRRRWRQVYAALSLLLFAVAVLAALKL